jgi:hypothetical protein
MKSNPFIQVVLLAIAIFLGMIAFRPLFTPAPVRAQGEAQRFDVEPGVYALRAPDGSRQIIGKVVVDLSNGKIWGFPTWNEKPYPVDVTKTVPPSVRPFYLGKFDFSGIDTP